MMFVKITISAEDKVFEGQKNQVHLFLFFEIEMDIDLSSRMAFFMVRVTD